MSWDDILDATALEQAERVRRREVSSEELARLYMERADRLDPRLAAFVSRLDDRALRAARRKDREVREGQPLAAFHGVPSGVKDLNFVRFAWTRLGTRGVPPLFSPFDDRTASAMRRAGFVILGKLATSELGAMPVTEPDTHPPTRNPWNLEHTPGGSSGGSGAAVAAGLLPIAHGSDGAGSIRIPAAFCHLYGIKPSRGRVRNAFGLRDRYILYTDGPIARSVEDAAAMLDVLAGLDIDAPHWAPRPARPFRELLKVPPRPMRIKLLLRTSFGETHPDILAAVTRAAKVLEELGHHVEEGAQPEASLEEFVPLWQHLVGNIPFVAWRRTQPITRWLGETGRRLKSRDIAALHKSFAERLLPAFESADLWVTPTVAVPPPRVGSYAGRPPLEAFTDAAKLGAFTAGFNLTGQPAASLPLGLTGEGLPMGLQIAGRRFREEDVLAVSRQLEEAMPWRGKLSPMARAS